MKAMMMRRMLVSSPQSQMKPDGGVGIKVLSAVIAVLSIGLAGPTRCSVIIIIITNNNIIIMMLFIIIIITTTNIIMMMIMIINPEGRIGDRILLESY
jgi:hypothetical protein